MRNFPFSHQNLARAVRRYKWEEPLVLMDMINCRTYTTVFERVGDTGVLRGKTTIEDFPDYNSPYIEIYEGQVSIKMIINNKPLRTVMSLDGFGKRYVNELAERVRINTLGQVFSRVTKEVIERILTTDNFILPTNKKGKIKEVIYERINNHGPNYVLGLGIDCAPRKPYISLISSTRVFLTPTGLLHQVIRSGDEYKVINVTALDLSI